MSISDHSVWVWTREGRVHNMFIEEEGSCESQDLDIMPVILSPSLCTRRWAVYDRRGRSVQIWESKDSRLLRKAAQSATLQTDNLPKYSTWLDDTTILLADSVSTIWAFTYNHDNTSIALAYTGRLNEKGIFSLQRDRRRPGVFHVGTRNGSTSYLFRKEGQIGSLRMLGSDCLHYGVVKEVNYLPLSTAKL